MTSYPVILCSRIEINFQLHTYIYKKCIIYLEYLHKMGHFIVAIGLSCITNVAMGGPLGTHGELLNHTRKFAVYMKNVHEYAVSHVPINFSATSCGVVGPSSYW